MQYWLTLSDKDPKRTDYMEFLPGIFHGKFWNPDSLYCKEEVFDEFLLPVFQKCIPDFDPYVNTTISVLQWKQITSKASQQYPSAQSVLKEAQDWFTSVWKSYDTITLLGL